MPDVSRRLHENESARDGETVLSSNSLDEEKILALAQRDIHQIGATPQAAATLIKFELVAVALARTARWSLPL
jgi:hypothetical protein